MSSSSLKTVTLKSSDGEIFVVEEPVAAVSETIENMIKEGRGSGIIPVNNVSGKILAKVINYCRRIHLESTVPASLFDKEEIEAWEHEFVQVDNRTLCDLEKAAQFFALLSLKDLIFQTMKDLSTGVSVQEACKRSGVPSDPLEFTLGKGSTEEEQSELWKEYSIVDVPPKETDSGKESSECSKAEESELWKEYSTVDVLPEEMVKPPVEADPSKNLGNESTEAEEKARGKSKIIE